MKVVRLIFWIVLICPHLLSAQNRLVRAGDKQFEKLAFTKAYSNYQKAYQKEEARQEARQEIALKIAETLMKLNNPAQAETWYAKGKDKLQNASPEYKFHYAEALSSNGKYEEAKKWYQLYSEEAGDEERVKLKIKAIENHQAFYKNVDFVTVTGTNFNSPQADFSPAFYDTSLVIVSSRDLQAEEFAWDDSHYLDLYQVSKNGVIIEKFDDKINSKYHEGPAVFFNNGNKIIFTRNNFFENRFGKSSKGVNKLKMFYAEKQTDGSWGEIVPLPFNSDEYSVGHPGINKDGSILYFASDMPGGQGGTDLYKSEWKDGQWQQPVNLGSSINTEGEEMFPFLLNDQELYFASNGHGGLGGLDLLGTKLSQDPEAEVVNLGAPINTKLDDFGMIVNTDGRTGYFSSNRENGQGSDDIYHFASSKPLLISPLVKGVVKDKEKSTPLAGALVVMKDEQGNMVDSAQAREDGSFSFAVLWEKKYTLEARQEEYREDKTSFSTINPKDQTEWETNLALLKDYEFSLVGLISESNTKRPLEGVSVELTDKMTGAKILEAKTNTSGTFRQPIENKKLNDSLSYQIKLRKEGYVGKTTIFEKMLSQPGEISLHEVLDLNLDKINLGNIGRIYFDLGKADIRPDAAKELDKIVEVLKDNPGIKIELGSHSDARGSSAANLALSDKRAKAAASYIISQGIDETRITGTGYGETQLINRCKDGIQCTEAEHEQNRRTEFKVTKL